MDAVILANGDFPQHSEPFKAICNAQTIVCCDGAVEDLLAHNLTPTAIIGDLDSLSDSLRHKFSSIIYRNPDQNCNDLTKAVRWCAQHSISRITIVGATGKREDHTLGNISLLVSYARMNIEVQMITDTGIIVPALKSTQFPSYTGQQVSFFSPLNITRVTTNNLKYPLTNAQLPELWNGTLNESLGSWFALEFNPGPLLVYRRF